MEWVTRPDDRGKVPSPEENASFLAQQRVLNPRAWRVGDPAVVRINELPSRCRRIDKKHALLEAPKGVLSCIDSFRRQYGLKEYKCYRNEGVLVLLARSTIDPSRWFVVACWDWNTNTVLTYKEAITVIEERDKKLQRHKWLKHNVTSDTVEIGVIIVGFIIAIIIAIVAWTAFPLLLWFVFACVVVLVEVA